MNIIMPLDNEKYEEYINRILSSRENIKDTENYQEKHPDTKEKLHWVYVE